jgi:hypothetical protein
MSGPGSGSPEGTSGAGISGGAGGRITSGAGAGTGSLGWGVGMALASPTETPRDSHLFLRQKGRNRGLPRLRGQTFGCANDRYSPTRMASNSGRAGGPRTIAIRAYNSVRV